jgi:hypothetical protein
MYDFSPLAITGKFVFRIGFANPVMLSLRLRKNLMTTLSLRQY